MHIRMILWNVRGLNSKEKRSQIWNALKMWNGEIICLQETKLSKIGRQRLAVCGAIVLQIGCLWNLRVLQGECSLCGINGRQKFRSGLKVSILFLVDLGMCRICLNGLSRLFMGRMLMLRGLLYGRSLLGFVVGRVCRGV